jgi:hypothetical protein
LKLKTVMKLKSLFHVRRTYVQHSSLNFENWGLVGGALEATAHIAGITQVPTHSSLEFSSHCQKKNSVCRSQERNTSLIIICYTGHNANTGVNKLRPQWWPRYVMQNV